MESPLTVAERTARWIGGNPEAFRAITGYIVSQARMGNPRTTRDQVLQFARNRRIQLGDGEIIARDHNLYAALTRYVALVRPETTATLHFRRSKLDRLDMQSVLESTTGTTLDNMRWFA